MPPVDEEVEDRGDVFIPDDEQDDEEITDLDDDQDYEDDEDVSEDDEDESDDDEADDDDDSSESDDDDSDDDDDVEDDDDEQGEDVKVPIGRLNQVLKQREEERERSAWLEEQLEALIKAQAKPEKEPDPEPEAPTYDYDEAELRFNNLLLEGDTDGATKLRKEISNARDAEYKFQIESIRRAAVDEAVSKTTKSIDETRFAALQTQYTTDYDFLNDESDNYNEKAVLMANHIMASYLSDGKTKSQALKLAVEDIVPLFETKKAAKPKAAANSRQKAARKKAAKASQSQPPSSRSTRGKSQRSLDSVSIEKMSEKDFDSMTAREKAKLRGDII